MERHLKLWEEARGRFMGFDGEEDQIVVHLSVGAQHLRIPIPVYPLTVQRLTAYLKRVPYGEIVGGTRVCGGGVSPSQETGPARWDSEGGSSSQP